MKTNYTIAFITMLWACSSSKEDERFNLIYKPINDYGLIEVYNAAVLDSTI
jgi:hypothetical protein